MQYSRKIIALVLSVCLLVGVMAVPSAAATDLTVYNLDDFYCCFNGEPIIVPGEFSSFYTVPTSIYSTTDSVSSFLFMINYSDILSSHQPISFPVDDEFIFRFYLPSYSYSGISFEHLYYYVLVGRGMAFDRFYVYPDGSVQAQNPDHEYTYSSGFDSFGQYFEMRGVIWFDTLEFRVSSYAAFDSSLADTKQSALVSFPAGADAFTIAFAESLPDSSSDYFPPSIDSTPPSDSNIDSILSAILSSISSLSHRQEQEFSALVEIIGMLWMRLRYIEQNSVDILALLESLIPSAEETALKTATAETTKAVAETVFAEDSATKVTASDVLDIAQVGTAASNMFDSGVSVGAFFDAFNDVGLIALFTDRTKNDLYAVEAISTYGFYDGNEVVDYYSENLNKIQNFVGGDG